MLLKFTHPVRVIRADGSEATFANCIVDLGDITVVPAGAEVVDASALIVEPAPAPVIEPAQTGQPDAGDPAPAVDAPV